MIIDKGGAARGGAGAGSNIGGVGRLRGQTLEGWGRFGV